MKVEQSNGHEEPIQYLHIRRPVIGYAMRGMYPVDSAACGGVTIAYQKVGAYYDVAFAQCSLEDHYNKRIGRILAKIRLDEGDSISVTLLEGETEKKVFTDLAYHMKEHKKNLKPQIIFYGSHGE